MGQTTEELNTEIAQTRDTLASDLDALQDRVSPSAIIERRKQATRGRIEGIRSRIMGSTGTATSSASGTVDDVRDSARDLAGSAEESIQGSPLAAGLIAFGAGMIVSALVPVSRAEAQASQRVVEAAKEHGQPLVDEAKSVGQDIGAGLQDSAAQAVEQVKTSAQDSVQRVQQEGQDSAETVRTQVQD